MLTLIIWFLGIGISIFILGTILRVLVAVLDWSAHKAKKEKRKAYKERRAERLKKSAQA